MWIKWITNTFKISKKPTWHWNAKSKKWLNLKKMDLISLWSKKVLKTKKVFKLIKSKKVSKTVRKAGWWMKTLTSSSLKSLVPLKRFQMQNSWKKTKEKEILEIKNNQNLEMDTKKVLKRCLFTRESILIKMKLLNKKQELKLTVDFLLLITSSKEPHSIEIGSWAIIRESMSNNSTQIKKWWTLFLKPK
jgi:hypothetical protein